MSLDDVFFDVSEFLGLWIARLCGLLLILGGLALSLGGIAIGFASTSPRLASLEGLAAAGAAIGGACLGSAVFSAGKLIIEDVGNCTGRGKL